jgi:hypothetical protein
MTDWIYQDVREMKQLVKSGGRIRKWDELFQKLFQHSNDLHLECIVKKEVKPRASTRVDTQRAVNLTQAHAQVVSLFSDNESQEVPKDHGEYVSGNC